MESAKTEHISWIVDADVFRLNSTHRRPSTKMVLIHFDRRSQGTQAGGAGGSRLEKTCSVLKRIRSGEPSPCSSSSTLEFSGPWASSSNLVCICEGRTLRSTTKRKLPSFSSPLRSVQFLFAKLCLYNTTFLASHIIFAPLLFTSFYWLVG